MIKYILKIIKKQNLLRKYKKGDKQWNDHIWLLKTWEWSEQDKHFFKHHFACELRCYNRLKKL